MKSRTKRHLAFVFCMMFTAAVGLSDSPPKNAVPAPSDAEIFRHHIFDVPLVPIGGQTSAEENAALGRAIWLYENATDRDDTDAIAHFLDAFPNSAWRSAVLTNLGLRYLETGWVSKSLAVLEEAWTLGKKETQPEGKALIDRTVGELASLYARLGQRDRLEALLGEIGDRVFVGGATEKITAARETLWLMINEPGNTYKCGPYALDALCRIENAKANARQRINEVQSTQKGTSLGQLWKLSRELGLDYQLAKRTPGAGIILPAIVHWKTNHYGTLTRQIGGKYVVQDPSVDRPIAISPAALDDESSGYFLVRTGALPEGWRSVSASEGTRIWGAGATTSHDPSGTKLIDDKCKPECGMRGMAYYNFHTQMVSLNITDTPIGYTPPFGPDVYFTLTYNQREMSDPPISNLGPKWTFNWFAYVTVDGSDYTVHPPGGGKESYQGLGVPGFQSGAILTGSVNPLRFERTLSDGSREIYEKVWNSNTVLLTALADPIGNLLQFHYEGERMTEVVDATGQLTGTTHIRYKSNDPEILPDYFLIGEVIDPFERSAILEYEDGKLSKIHDVIGITSEFVYETGGDFIHTMTTPYGQTTFSMPTPFSTELLGGDGNLRTLQAVEPDGGTERLEYGHSAPGISAGESIFPDVPGGFTNGFYHNRNSFYWDKKAIAVAPGNYTKARLTHWLHINATQSSNIKEREKQPLENPVYYLYPGQPGNTIDVGTTGFPSVVARVLDNSDPVNSTQIWRYDNRTPSGRPKKVTDPKGRVTTYKYASNGIDLEAIYQQRPGGQSTDEFNMSADQIAAFTYNSPAPAHRPDTATDAAGQSATYTYRANGQLETMTNAKQETITYAFGDGTTVPLGYLASIIGPQVDGSSPATNFTYDDAHRIHTITDSDGYMVIIDYDALDRPTQLSYPDNTTRQFLYTDSERGMTLDLTASKDRLNRWTYRHYNSNRQIDSITDPLARTTHYNWCSCGSLDSIRDAKNQTTTFYRDLQSRVYQKVFADGSTVNYLYEGQTAPNMAGATSRLKSMTDASNQRTEYEYLTDNNLQQISYSNAQHATPKVVYGYDPYYNRVLSITTEGIGATTYTYYPVGSNPTLGATKLQTVDGPFSNDTITYTYDELGRVLTQSINGAAETVTYDALGRLDTTDNSLGYFDREYEGVTPRLATLTYPYHQVANYEYFENNKDRRLETIQNLAGGANLSQFDYDYDPEGQIESWIKLLGATTADRWFTYDAAMQLKTSRNTLDPNDSTSRLDYTYDDAGNRATDRNYDPHSMTSGTLNSYDVNAVNQIETITSVVDGFLSLEPRTLTHDAVGNLANDGAGKTFEWDAANRLIAISYANGNRTEFAYDGLGHRVKITEYGPGVTAEIQPADTNYATFTAGPFTLPSGNCTLTLQGLNPRGGDSTTLVDAVSLSLTESNIVLVPNGSFESPVVTDYQDNPTGTWWSFVGSAGVAANEGTYTSDNPNAPDGDQVAFIRNNGSISQTLNLSAGSYMLQFMAAQRGSNNDGAQQLRVILRSPSSVISAKTFVWCRNRICEERDGSGANVRKRFFADGEQRINGITIANFYYTRDHLGSIREITNENGELQAQYDYDPYGNRVVVSGKMDADFGFTGHYFHQPSGLYLTLYRAYDPTIGRWISRDPIGEDGGLNLYGYVSNNALNDTDRLGLLVDAYFNIAQGVLTVIDRDTGVGVIVRAHSGSGIYRGDPTAIDVREHTDVNGDLVGGPIPYGRYSILNDPLARGWYDLDMQDRTPGNDENDNGPSRSALRLHPGFLSTGCVTVPNGDEYRRLTNILANTRTAQYRDASGHRRIDYGALNVFSTTSPRAVFP